MPAYTTSLLLPRPSACLPRASSAPPFPAVQFPVLLQGVQVPGGAHGANTLCPQGPMLAPWGGEASKPGHGDATVGARVGYWSVLINRHHEKVLCPTNLFAIMCFAKQETTRVFSSKGRSRGFSERKLGKKTLSRENQ